MDWYKFTQEVAPIQHPLPKRDMKKFYFSKVIDVPNGYILGPKPLKSNKGHADNSLDWKQFHKELPELEAFTEMIIDIDSQAFRDDRYFKVYAKRMLEDFFGAFVTATQFASKMKQVSLEAEIAREVSAGRKTQATRLRTRVEFLENMWACVDHALYKARVRFGVANKESTTNAVDVETALVWIQMPGEHANETVAAAKGKKVYHPVSKLAQRNSAVTARIQQHIPAPKPSVPILQLKWADLKESSPLRAIKDSQRWNERDDTESLPKTRSEMGEVATTDEVMSDVYSTIETMSDEDSLEYDMCEPTAFR